MSPAQFKRLRTALGLTMTELAARLQVNVSTVSRWERGKRKVSGPVALLMKRFVGKQSPYHS